MSRPERPAPPTAPDRVRVHPAALSGTVAVPGDKSVSHRSLIIGALVGETVEVSGVADSGDVRSTARALTGLGVSVELAPVDGRLAGTVTGPVREPATILDCGNSGTALRLLAGVVAGIDGLSVLTGDGSLVQRPVDRVAEPLRKMGATVDARGGGRVPPLVVRGGQLHGIRYEQPVASAQVKSCLLLAGLVASGATTVVSPYPSRDHTERMLRHLGATVRNGVTADGRDGVEIEPGSLRPAPLQVPRDPSSAAFWHVAGVLGGNGAVVTPGVSANPTRTGALRFLEELGADVDYRAERTEAGESVADVTVVPSELAGGRLAGRFVVDAIDELPVLALAGALSRDGIEVADAAELRVKESDRIATLGAAFDAMGMELDERPDGFVVPGGQRPAGGVVDAAGDHRIAMTAAIAGCVASAPVEISGFGSVSTSYPGFLDDLARLGGRAEVLAS